VGNTLQEQTCYNSRLQISGLRAGTAAFNTDCSNQAGDLLALSYDYGSTNNNGNLQKQKINVPWSDGSGIHTQMMTQSYGYDTLNRINYTGETVNGLPSGVNQGSWSWNFDADQYGNASGTNNLGLSAPLMPASSAYFDTATNRLSKYGASPGTALPNDAYDAAGNLQHHPELCQNDSNTPCMQYDGEGRLIQVTNGGNVAHYDYDGEGRRVRKTETGGNPVTTVYVHDAGGNLIAEYTRGGTTETGPRYLTADHLGNTRLVTDGSGAIIQRLDYFPFGQTIPAGESYGNRNASRIPGYGATSTLTLQFTGKERDAETGLDYFGARYFSGAQGRFTSPDPVVITSDRLKNPQQLNLYAYVANNPLRYLDPTGAILVASGNQQADYDYLCQIAGDACKDRLKIDEKTGNVTFDIKDLDLSKNEGAKVLNDLVTSQNTYEFSVGPTIATDKGPVKIDYILANLPAFGDQRQVGQPRAGVADVVGFNFGNKKVTRGSNTNRGVAPEFTVVFHELAEAFQKIDAGKGNSYEAGHNAALEQEKILRDQRPYLKDYNTGAGGPANSPNPEGKIIIKR
jgi:RHS repeat-associated protein